MSNQINTNLLERASVVATIYEGTWVDKAIENAIANNDLVLLEYIVRESERDIEEAESRNDDPMTDERAEAIYDEIY